MAKQTAKQKASVAKFKKMISEAKAIRKSKKVAWKTAVKQAAKKVY
jgi:hypothetical protein